MNYPTEPPNTSTVASSASDVDEELLHFIEPWKQKKPIKRFEKIATFGSCFAQGLGPALKEHGYTWLEAEPAPDIFSPEIRAQHNYEVFSARTGVIRTVASLRQWISWALDKEKPPEEVWQMEARFFDPFRPSIEPNGFATFDELLESRRTVLRAMRHVAEHADWLIFSLGSAAGWLSSATGHVYPMHPNEIGRTSLANDCYFNNYSLADVCADLSWVINTLSAVNNKMRFILTVSATPSTAADRLATLGDAPPSSQSLLRTAAVTMAETQPLVDYFPSYEIITTPPPPSGHARTKDGRQRVPIDRFELASRYFFYSLAGSSRNAVPAVQPRIASKPSGSDISRGHEFWSRVLKTRNDLRGIF